MDERQRRVRARKGRIQLRRPLEQRSGSAVVAAIEAIQVLQAKMIGGPRIEVFHRGEARKGGFVERDAKLERHEDLSADLLAHRVHVVDPAREAIRPDDGAVGRIHELDDDDETVGRRLDRARQVVAHAEQPADIAEIGVGCAHAERRAARRDEQPVQPRQIRDQLIGQSTRESGVAVIAGDEPKRQYGERWSGQPVEALHEVCHGGVGLPARLRSDALPSGCGKLWPARRTDSPGRESS